MIRRRQLGGALAGALAAPALFAAEPTVDITIVEYRFQPERLVVPVGTTVRWINQERRTTHSVLFTGPGGHESERLFPGDTWQRRFDQPGSYPYRCGPHPEMKGLVEVSG